MTYQHKELRGSTFPNDRKEADTHPDWTGSALIGGVEYWINEWDGQTQDGQQIRSFSFKPKQGSAQPVRNQQGYSRQPQQYRQQQPQQQYTARQQPQRAAATAQQGPRRGPPPPVRRQQPSPQYDDGPPRGHPAYSDPDDDIPYGP